MTDVQLAEHLGEHLGELVVVADVREVLGIDGADRLPVDAVVAGGVEGIARPTPDVVKELGAFGGDVDGHLAAEWDRVAFAGGGIDLGDRPVGEEEDRLLIPVPRHAAAGGVERHELLGLARAQVGGPEIGSALKAREIVEGLAILAHQGVAERGRVDGKARLALLDAGELERNGGDDDRAYGRRGQGGGARVRLGLRQLGLRLLHQRVLLLGESEPVPRALGEEHPIDVVLCAARLRDGLESVPIREPEHPLPLEDPACASVVEAALREIGHGTASIGGHDAHFSRRDARHREIEEDRPAVGTPFEVLARVVRPDALPVEQRARLAAGDGAHPQRGAILEVRQLPAVG